MSNALRCKTVARRYATLSALTNNAEIRRAYQNLERLWLDMAGHCDRFDRTQNEDDKQSVYEIIDKVRQHRVVLVQ
jgi:hypothetical protein